MANNEPASVAICPFRLRQLIGAAEIAADHLEEECCDDDAEAIRYAVRDAMKSLTADRGDPDA